MACEVNVITQAIQVTAETAVWILWLLFCGIDLTVVVDMCLNLHRKCPGVRVQYHGQCHATAVSFPLIRSVWKVGSLSLQENEGGTLIL